MRWLLSAICARNVVGPIHLVTFYAVSWISPMPTTNVIMVPWSWIKLLVFTTRKLGILESKSPELSAARWALRKSWALSLSFLWRYAPWQPKATYGVASTEMCARGYLLIPFGNMCFGCTLRMQVCPKKEITPYIPILRMGLEPSILF